MLYTIVESFGHAGDDSWKNYLEWRGLNFKRFDSLDGMLRPSLFTPETVDDWDHVVCDNFMIDFMNDRDFAQRAHSRIGAGDLVGFTYEDHDQEDPGFLGYDIIDGYSDISLITNWGNDVEIINRALASNALLATIDDANRIHDYLINNHAKDPHVEDCKIISIYSIPPTENTKEGEQVGAGDAEEAV